MGEKQAPDWERIESDYRAGVKSLREMATEHGITHRSISKRAEKGGWVRDLKVKILAKAEALVSRAVVSGEVSTVSAAQVATERRTIDANAQAVADVKLAHRTDIRRGRALVNKLLGELEGVTDNLDLIEDLQQALFQAESGGEDGDEIDRQAARGRAQRLRDALERVIGLQGRVSSVKGLAESMRILITLEREAWGLDTDTTPDGVDGGRTLSDVERAARLASILDRARRAKAEAEKT